MSRIPISDKKDGEPAVNDPRWQGANPDFVFKALLGSVAYRHVTQADHEFKRIDVLSFRPSSLAAHTLLKAMTRHKIDMRTAIIQAVTGHFRAEAMECLEARHEAERNELLTSAYVGRSGLKRMRGAVPASVSEPAPETAKELEPELPMRPEVPPEPEAPPAASPVAMHDAFADLHAIIVRFVRDTPVSVKDVVNHVYAQVNAKRVSDFGNLVGGGFLWARYAKAHHYRSRHKLQNIMHDRLRRLAIIGRLQRVSPGVYVRANTSNTEPPAAT